MPLLDSLHNSFAVLQEQDVLCPQLLLGGSDCVGVAISLPTAKSSALPSDSSALSSSEAEILAAASSSSPSSHRN